jgi:hypothetical protein
MRAVLATRKGLFELTRHGQYDWRLALAGFIADPVSMVLHDQRDGTLYAALNLGHFGAKLHRRDAGSATWVEIAVPTYPVQPVAAAAEEAGAASSAASSASSSSSSSAASSASSSSSSSAASSASAPDVEWKLRMIWSLAAGGADQPGVLWAGTLPGGLFRSSDRGDSWQLVESLWHMPARRQWFGGGNEAPGMHSICIDPRNSNHIWVAVSCGGVWHSADGGASWASRTRGMRATYMPPELAESDAAQDPHLIVQCPGQPAHFWCQHHNGIWRSSDAAQNWQQISPQAVDGCALSDFGFAVAVHPNNPNCAWFVPAVADQCRIPGDAALMVTRTTDGGQSFTALKTGLPQQDCYDLIYRHGLAVADDGQTLLMGSTTGGLWVSENGGDAWHLISHTLPPIYAVQFANAPP